MPATATVPAAECARVARPTPDNLSATLAVGSTLGVGIAFIAHATWVSIAVALVLAAGGAVGVLRGAREAAALALAVAVFVALLFIPEVARLTPAPLLLALGVVLLASRFRAPWLVRGQIGGVLIGWVALIVVASGAALLAWWKLAAPDVSDLTLASSLRRAVSHPAILAVALVGWSALNAVAEEFFFRGALQHTLTRTFGPAVGILMQAAAFGLVHYRGFPRGWSGVVLAATYGVMLGALRLRAQGLLAPWLAHVGADIVIAVILLTVAR